MPAITVGLIEKISVVRSKNNYYVIPKISNCGVSPSDMDSNQVEWLL